MRSSGGISSSFTGGGISSSKGASNISGNSSSSSNSSISGNSSSSSNSSISITSGSGSTKLSGSINADLSGTSLASPAASRTFISSGFINGSTRAFIAVLNESIPCLDADSGGGAAAKTSFFSSNFSAMNSICLISAIPESSLFISFLGWIRGSTLVSGFFFEFRSPTNNKKAIIIKIMFARISRLFGLINSVPSM